MFERRLRTTWTLGLCLVLAGVACGRGGAADAQASPRTYVSTVCGAVLDWKSVIEVRSSALIGEDDSVANTTAYFNRRSRTTSWGKPRRSVPPSPDRPMTPRSPPTRWPR